MSSTLIARRSLALLLLGTAGLGAQVSRPIILRVDVADWVSYEANTADFARFASNAEPVAAGSPRAFFQFIAIGDIVNVNGQPARGTLLFRTTRLGTQTGMSPTPLPGDSIADVTRGTVSEWVFEFLQMDGTQIGSIVALGLPNGPPPPGAPRGSIGHSMAITGGTGAFIGVKGQMTGARPFTLPAPGATRRASVLEDPSKRRVNGGINSGFFIQFTPAERPELVDTRTVPMISHPDFSPVTAANPARPGETIIFTLRGLGATNPALEGDETFPADTFAEVTSPVTATVNGTPATVVTKVGFPGTNAVYRVDVQLPAGLTSGNAQLRITAAWVPSQDISVPIAAR